MSDIGLYTWSVVAVSAAAAILFTIGAYAWKRNRKSEQLRLLFGAEYDRAVRLYGDQQRAEKALESRRKRLEEFGVHELSELDRDRLRARWQMIYSNGAADPANIMVQADVLLAEVMRTEGYPLADAGERQVDLALLHPTIAEDYRQAVDVLERHRLGIATPDDRRSAVRSFSRIFDSILGPADIRDRLKKVS